MQHLADRRAGPPVQRSIENATYAPDITDEDRAAVDAFYAGFEGSARKAYEYALSVPSLTSVLAATGSPHLQRWVTLWERYLSGQVTGQMAAAFGYVVETLACGVFAPAAPAGCSLSYQVAHGGTRPDVVLRRISDSRTLAWIDLTAAASVNHIFSKEGWGTKVASFAEVTYPSLDPGSLAVMRANATNTDPIDPADLAAQHEAARAEYAAQKEVWRRWGTQYTTTINRASLRGLSDELRQWFVQRALEVDFGTTVPAELVPSILMAMGAAGGPWGYTTGYTVSEKAGDSWLVDHPQVTQDRSWVPEWRNVYVPVPVAEQLGAAWAPRPSRTGGPIRREGTRHRDSPY